MNLTEFEALDSDAKEQLIGKQGIFLVNYIQDDHVCDIYALFEFYIACCYDLDRTRERAITCHEDPEELPNLWKLRLGTGDH